MTTNAESMRSTYRQNEVDRLKENYPKAQRDLGLLWNNQQIQAAYVQDEIAKLQTKADRYAAVLGKDPLGGVSFYDQEFEARKQQVIADEKYAKAVTDARKAYNSRWDNGSLAIALGSVSDATTGQLRKLWGTEGWQEEFVGVIEEAYSKADVDRAMTGLTGDEKRMQAWNAGVQYVDVIMSKIPGQHGIPREAIAAALANTYLFRQHGISGDALTAKELNKAKQDDLDKYVTAVVGDGPVDFMGGIAELKKSRAQMAPEQLERLEIAEARARTDIAEAKAELRGLQKPYTEQDIQALQAQYQYGLPARRGPVETMMDDMSDAEKIRYRAALRAQKHAPTMPDLTKDGTPSGKYANQLRSMMEGGMIQRDDVLARASELAESDADLRDDILMKFYSWDVKEEQNMRFEDPKAVRQIDMGETDLRPEDFWQMPTDSPFSLGGGPQEEWYGPSTPTEEQHFARPPFSSAMPGGMGNITMPDEVRSGTPEQQQAWLRSVKASALGQNMVFPDATIPRQHAPPMSFGTTDLRPPPDITGAQPPSAFSVEQPWATPYSEYAAAQPKPEDLIVQKYGVDPSVAKSIADEAGRRGQDPMNWAGLIAAKSAFDPGHANQFGEPGLIRFNPAWLAQMGVRPGDIATMPIENQVSLMGEYFDFIESSKAKGITVPQMAPQPAVVPSPTTNVFGPGYAEGARPYTQVVETPTTSVFGPGYAEGARPYTQVVETPTENVFATPTTRTRPYTQVVETPTTSVFGPEYAPGARPYTQVVETPTTNRDLVALEEIVFEPQGQITQHVPGANIQHLFPIN